METEQLKGMTKLSLPDAQALSDEERALLTAAGGAVAIFLLRGSFSYASARELARRAGAEAIGHSAIVYDFSEAACVDTSVALSVEELLEQTTAAGVACFIAGMSSPAARTLGQLNVLDRVPSSRRFEQRIDAIRAAAGEVERQKTREAAASSGYDRPAPAS